MSFSLNYSFNVEGATPNEDELNIIHVSLVEVLLALNHRVIHVTTTISPANDVTVTESNVSLTEDPEISNQIAFAMLDMSQGAREAQ